MTRVIKYEMIKCRGEIQLFRPVDISDLSENQKLELIHNIVMERDEALETIKQRDKEINALKHMLDRRDDEK